MRRTKRTNTNAIILPIPTDSILQMMATTRWMQDRSIQIFKDDLSEMLEPLLPPKYKAEIDGNHIIVFSDTNDTGQLKVETTPYYKRYARGEEMEALVQEILERLNSLISEC